MNALIAIILLFGAVTYLITLSGFCYSSQNYLPDRDLIVQVLLDEARRDEFPTPIGDIAAAYPKQHWRLEYGIYQ